MSCTVQLSASVNSANYTDVCRFLYQGTDTNREIFVGLSNEAKTSGRLCLYDMVNQSIITEHDFNNEVPQIINLGSFPLVSSPTMICIKLMRIGGLGFTKIENLCIK